MKNSTRHFQDKKKSQIKILQDTFKIKKILQDTLKIKKSTKLKFSFI